MAAIGMVLSVAQTLFSALESSVLKEICSIMGYQSELNKLKSTVSTVKAVLLDAEAKQQEMELSHQALVCIEKLKDAVYDADDLLDKLTTLAEQKQLMEGSKFSKEVRVFFLRFNQLGVACTMSLQIKNIRMKLDAIAKDQGQFSQLIVDYNKPVRRRQESCSYIYDENVIGREDDMKVIIDRLLDDNVQGKVSFLTIVGIGGLVKTTLAQLVYNDERIKTNFALRMWACISDQDQKQLDLKAILGRILESITEEKHADLGLDILQRKLLEKLEGKKYLLVLDDVWTENRVEWLQVGDLLMTGGRGSRVLVTTRSKETARIIGKGLTHELQGLSKENSWRLFEIMAFDQDQRQANPPDLVEIGKKIVETCACVPLAIRVVGSLLFGQGKNKWLLFQKNGLAKIAQDENGVIPILKLSYYHLQSPLKSCFIYCALFPKGFVITKHRLISLWIAQGYVVPVDGQSLEDIAEEYFMILLQRCFFQDAKKDGHGEIVEFKIHDLMHDLAREVVGEEICAVNSITSSLNMRTRHLVADRSNGTFESTRSCLTKSNIRTFVSICLAFVGTFGRLPISTVLEKWTHLRALDLRHFGIKQLPRTIGKLLHLRYLDLSGNGDLEMLPKSITKLYNLQTLKLGVCCNLKELPKDLSKLIKLRLLNTSGCYGLTCMPPGMDKLTCLHELTMFVVAEKSSSLEKCVGQLEDIKHLTNLKGHLTIRIPGNYPYAKFRKKGGCLLNKEHLTEVNIKWGSSCEAWRVDYDEALLEDLQPHPNLGGLSLDGYCGTKIPSWARTNMETSLPNLVTIRLQNCAELHHLPLLGQLRYLKSLRLENLQSLKYVENISCGTASASQSMEAELSCFPSLEVLKLCELPELEGWWRGLGSQDEQLIDDSSSSSSTGSRQPFLSLSFPRLSKLTVKDCPKLTSLPTCPSVERLFLHRFNRSLPSIVGWSLACQSLLSDTENPKHSKLRRVETDNVGYLKSLPVKCVTEMQLCRDEELERLSEVGDVFKSCSSSLRSLVISHFPKLRSLCGALEYLTELESLRIQEAPNLEISEEEEGNDNGMPWRSLGHSLCSLELRSLPKLVNLPKGLQHLTALESLNISFCHNLEALPGWISCLSSLRSIKISHCTRLQSLPEEMLHLNSSRKLKIWGCPHLPLLDDK